MKRLIITTSDSGAGSLKFTRLADIVIPLTFEFAWGPLPTDAEMASWLVRRSSPDDQDGAHWWWELYWDHFGEDGRNEIGFIDFCERCETIDLWIDPVPGAQLQLSWLLDYLRPRKEIISKLTLLQADAVIADHSSRTLAKWRLPAAKIANDHLEVASAAWRAWRAPTPQDWFGLLSENLSVLPQLQPTVVELLEELPMPATGLGATEMRLLKLISVGKKTPFDVFPGYRKRNKRRVFGYWDIGPLLDGLAHCPAPAVSGLDEGPFTDEMHHDRNRLERYKQSRLSLTPLGKAILAGTEDFSRHNPISRWWGGTRLTNDNLWRWDPVKRALVAP